MKKLILLFAILITGSFAKAQDNICPAPDASQLSVNLVSGLDEATISNVTADYLIIYLKDATGAIIRQESVTAPYYTMWINPAIMASGTYTVQYAYICHETNLGIVWSQPSAPVIFTINPLNAPAKKKKK